jgi:hypothetical protein
MAAMTGDYQFSAEPRTVKAKAEKYRDQEDSTKPVNIMIDKRVIRGSTFTSMIIPASTQQELEKKQEFEKKRISQIQAKEKTVSQEGEREVGTPEPVEGRQHIDVQTENIPEELSEKPVEFEIEVQTDYYIDRPPTPLFMPKKTGEDEETQVEDGELFDFDIEVDPILEVLVGKTLEISRMEVLEEEELHAMKDHQREFEQKRRNELNEVQRLEGEEIRKREEAKARKREAKTKKENMQFAHKKFISRIMAKKYLGKLAPTSFEDLKALGTYNDIQEISFHDQLIPWLISTTADCLNTDSALQELFSSVLKESFGHLKSLHVKALEGEKDRKENERLAEIQSQKDEEDRKKRRVQMRIQKKLEQERKILKGKIEEKIIMTGSLVERITSNIISDIDGRQAENIIGTPGGLIGELVQLFSSVEEVLAMRISQDQINAILLDFISHTMKSPLMIYNNISERLFSEFIKTLNRPGLAFETIHTAGDDIKPIILSFILNPSNAVPGTSLTTMWTNLHDFSIREGLIESVITGFFSVFTLKDIDATHPNPNRLKVELRPIDLDQHNEAAVVRICVPQKENENGELEDVDPVEDKIVLINPTGEEHSVFVIHQTAQKVLRNDLTYWIKTIRAFETVDIEALRSHLKMKAQYREHKLLSMLAQDLPVFDFYV